MLRGEQLKVKAPGTNRRRNIFITLFYPSKRIKYLVRRKRRSRELMEHLEAVIRYIRKKGYRKLIVIMDNAPAHKSKEAAKFLLKHKDIVKPFFLPRYAPHLNPVEGKINRALKRDICSNHSYDTIENVKESVRHYLRKYNGRHQLRDLASTVAHR